MMKQANGDRDRQIVNEVSYDTGENGHGHNAAMMAAVAVRMATVNRKRYSP